jgi:hypothetical protein
LCTKEIHLLARSIYPMLRTKYFTTNIFQNTLFPIKHIQIYVLESTNLNAFLYPKNIRYLHLPNMFICLMFNKHSITIIHTMRHIKYATNLELYYKQQLNLRTNKIHYSVASRYVKVKMTTSSGYYKMCQQNKVLYSELPTASLRYWESSTPSNSAGILLLLIIWE